MSTFLGRLTFLMIVFILGFLILWLPGGPIIMGMSCNGRGIDGMDWILSIFVPFYGVLEAMVC